MTGIDLNIPLNKKQVRMYNLLCSGKYKEFLFYGASRSGKTFLVLYFFIVQAVVFGANSLILRYTFTALQMGMLNQTLPDVLRAIAKHNGYSRIADVEMHTGVPFCKFNGKLNTLNFYNGAYIQFGAIKGSSGTENSFDKLLSTEWGHAFIDEVSEVPEAPVNQLISRMAQRMGFRNMLIYALNPCSKLHWAYRKFFKHETADGLKMDDDLIEQLYVQHFSIDDNRANIAEDYELTLRSTSRITQRRFLEGEWYDESEGEIFKSINWAKVPDAKSIVKAIIYTDPSAKEDVKNDYKASVLLCQDHLSRIWLWDLRAVQGTAREMLEGIYELYKLSPIPPAVYMEKRQVPLHFDQTFMLFKQEKGWNCPLRWDTRNHGNKFYNIESTLEPMFRNHSLLFNEKLKATHQGALAVDQFISFSRKGTRKDDIPDATAKGVSVLSHAIAWKAAADLTDSKPRLIQNGFLTQINC